ncbi:hypothetical protein [Bradyrhizobium canariense]|uniref:PsiF repeat-containing protein n=1 Tax=Bradyrhizobium canariense TaxID=255045 RepID=A0A1H1QD92_9BRAD|nr:hypothetical protein [Bradyrhizobium canariense]SDS21462.1 hypothetical protein SAMN05444158_1365 [Bradyrhizobium canariense]
MLNAKFLFGLALFIPLFGLAMPAEAQKAQKRDVNAIRAECFRQANEAAASAGVGAAAGNTAERNALGYSAYRACAQKNGIRP